MKMINPVDAARIELLLADLRLPAIKLMWTKLAEQSDKEGWPAARFLAALAEHEIADRGRRRIEHFADVLAGGNLGQLSEAFRSHGDSWHDELIYSESHDEVGNVDGRVARRAH